MGLHVVRRRLDGYHDIDTVMVPLKGLTDALEFVPSQSVDRLHITGLPIPGSSQGNICCKAVELLRTLADIPPQEIHLHKVIPMGAGMGGGSADGAFLLKALAESYEMGLSPKKLESLASELGSDCAFFIKNEPARATGRGELLEPLRLAIEGRHVVVVYPGIHISTPEAYGAITPKERATDFVESLISRPVEEWRNFLENDFEAYAFSKYPQLAAIKEMLYTSGAAYAAMSGSGSAIFGIFNEAPLRDFAGYWPKYFVHSSDL